MFDKFSKFERDSKYCHYRLEDDNGYMDDKLSLEHFQEDYNYFTNLEDHILRVHVLIYEYEEIVPFRNDWILKTRQAMVRPSDNEIIGNIIICMDQLVKTVGIDLPTQYKENFGSNALFSRYAKLPRMKDLICFF